MMSSRTIRASGVWGAALLALALAGSDVGGPAHAVPPTAAADAEVTLVGRAIMPDGVSPGPWDAAPNLQPDLTSPGGNQPVGGFSALVRDRHGDLWAMPDNGYGTQAASPSFVLRMYRVEPHFETATGGSGDVDVLKNFSLRDPNHVIPWPIVSDGTKDRFLTGYDFDIEAVRQAPDGTWWFSDEFGPFLLHTDGKGKLLEPPVVTPGVCSSENPLRPPGVAPNLARTSGFEAMALTTDGKRLLPVLEGPVTGQNLLDRTMFEYDIKARSYTGRNWIYPMSEGGGASISDMTALDEHRYVTIERDNGQGPLAQWKRVFLIDFREADSTGRLVKHQLADLLALHDPAEISLPARPGDIGLGTNFSMPYFTVEAVLPWGNGRNVDRLAIVNDTNYGSTGRNPGLPDYSDFILIKVPGLSR